MLQKPLMFVFSLVIALTAGASASAADLDWQVQVNGSQYVRSMDVGTAEVGYRQAVQTTLDFKDADRPLQVVMNALLARQDLLKGENPDPNDIEKADQAVEAAGLALGALFKKQMLDAKKPGMTATTRVTFMTGVGGRDNLGVTLRLSTPEDRTLVLIAVVPAKPLKDGQIQMVPHANAIRGNGRAEDVEVKGGTILPFYRVLVPAAK